MYTDDEKQFGTSVNSSNQRKRDGIPYIYGRFLYTAHASMVWILDFIIRSTSFNFSAKVETESSVNKCVVKLSNDSHIHDTTLTYISPKSGSKTQYISVTIKLHTSHAGYIIYDIQLK